jgi:predicted peptidase
MKKLHLLIAALIAALTLLPFSATQSQAHARSAKAGTFTLNAKVLDGGQQIVSLTIRTGHRHILASSLSASTFSVQATGRDLYGLPAPDVLGAFNKVDRTVTGAHLDRSGNIVVELAYGFGVEGANTLAYALAEARNLVLDLTYTVTQKQPITLWGGASYTFGSFTQGKVVDPEVDAYGSGSAAGLSYRLFTPSRSAQGKRPLIIWLHGGGEGGWAQAQNNDLPLLANRGALGFSTPKAQRIFGGAYVLAPQATDFWLNDPLMGYSAKLKALIDRVVKTHRIDRNRIYVAGASNGGFMAPKLVVDNPRFFAAEVPIAPALVFQRVQGVPPEVMISDAELASIHTPTWVVQSKDDPVVPFPVNGQHMAAMIPGALLTAYDNVTYGGVSYNGHWSWIYVARNDPTNAKGQHIWQWMAKQTLKSGHHHGK